MKRERRYNENLVYVLANYTLATHSSVRKTAKVFHISKSSVHDHLHIYLKLEDSRLFDAIDKVLQENIAIGAREGGLKTQQLRKEKENDKNK